MNDYRTLEKKWLAQNPLRQWRADNNLFLKDVGAAVGVGYHTVFRWENGMSMPNNQQMNLLMDITNDKDLQKKFQNWKDSRPVLGKL